MTAGSTMTAARRRVEAAVIQIVRGSGVVESSALLFPGNMVLTCAITADSEI